jgi:hypothetical protein
MTGSTPVAIADGIEKQWCCISRYDL